MNFVRTASDLAWLCMRGWQLERANIPISVSLANMSKSSMFFGQFSIEFYGKQESKSRENHSRMRIGSTSLLHLSLSRYDLDFARLRAAGFMVWALTAGDTARVSWYLASGGVCYGAL